MATRLANYRELAILILCAPLGGHSAMAQLGPYDHPVALAIADEIVRAFQSQVPLSPCKDIPFQLIPSGTDDMSIVLRQARKGNSPITISVDPAVSLSKLPAYVADILNRIQDAGGPVKTAEEPNGQLMAGGAQALQYFADQSLKAITDTVSNLITATARQWASAGLGRYSATVYLTQLQPVPNLVDKVLLTCVH